MKKSKNKGFTWRELKNILDKMDDKQLKQNAVVLREDMGIDGVIHTVEITKVDLMIDCDDDSPAPLIKRTKLSKDELEEYEVYIPENSLIAHI